MSGLFVQEEWMEVRGERRIGFGQSNVYETGFETTGDLYRACVREHGRCIGKLFVEVNGKPSQVGWTFLRRRRYEDSNDTYLQETWVTVREAPDTVIRVPHYAVFA